MEPSKEIKPSLIMTSMIHSQHLEHRSKEDANAVQV
jgi:hypothetical protein